MISNAERDELFAKIQIYERLAKAHAHQYGSLLTQNKLLFDRIDELEDLVKDLQDELEYLGH